MKQQISMNEMEKVNGGYIILKKNNPSKKTTARRI